MVTCSKRRWLPAFFSPVRTESLCLLVISVAVLILSFVLTPNPRGYGTHTELLLMPCMFHTLTGYPCPFCGMTTGFTHMARGQVRAAALCNLMAPPGFLLTILLVLGSLWGLIFNRAWIPSALGRPKVQKVLLCLLAVFWAANLTIFCYLRH